MVTVLLTDLAAVIGQRRQQRQGNDTVSVTAA
jgi:hypothetical protein